MLLLVDPYSIAATKKATAMCAPAVAAGAAAPVKVTMGAAGVVEDGATLGISVDEGATGVGVVTTTGADEDQSAHELLADTIGAGGGAGTDEVQSAQ